MRWGIIYLSEILVLDIRLSLIGHQYVLLIYRNRRKWVTSTTGPSNCELSYVSGSRAALQHVRISAGQQGDANMRAVWLFSRNDAIGNAAVVVAAGLVAWLGSAWPDLIVAFGIAGLFLHSSWAIIRDARADLKTTA